MYCLVGHDICNSSFPSMEIGCHGLRASKQLAAEMSTNQDWIRTDANFGRIKTGSDCNFFENWQIRTESDWENLFWFNV